MASFEQDFMFGKFDDLSPEEFERIFNILHGQRGEAATKVEFPWDGEEEELRGAVGGKCAVGGCVYQKNWAEETIEFGFQDNSYKDNVNDGSQLSFMSGETQILQSGSFSNSAYVTGENAFPVDPSVGQYLGGNNQYPSNTSRDPGSANQSHDNTSQSPDSTGQYLSITRRSPDSTGQFSSITRQSPDSTGQYSSIARQSPDSSYQYSSTARQSPDSTGQYSNISITGQYSGITGQDQYPLHYNVPGSGQYPVEAARNQYSDERDMSEYSQTGDQFDFYDERSGANSKLQASMKPYERRNKKKRPPGYYKPSDGSVLPEDIQEYGPPQPDITQPPPNFHTELHFNVPPPGLDPNQFTLPNFHAGVSVAYQGATTQSNEVGIVLQRTSDNVPTNQRQDTGDLCEIVIDSVPPQNIANIPARPETYQIQDHERTNSECSVDSNIVNNQRSATVQAFHHNSGITIENKALTSNMAGAMKPTRVDVSIKDAVVLDDSSHMQSNDAFESEHTHTIESNIAANAEDVVANNSNATDYSNQTADSNISNTSKLEPDSTELKTNFATMNQEPVLTVQQEPDISHQEPAIAKQEPFKPKPTSWAGLFKAKSANVTVSMAPVSTSLGDNSSVNVDSVQKSEKELSPVPASEDSAAKDLGEHLCRMSISHTSVSLQPRGLVNRANWCYINGTLQALIACPPFYNLLKKMPRYPALSRGPSSTPILDSLVEFTHEFQPMSRNFDKGHKGVRDITPGAPFEPVYVYKMLQAIAVNLRFKMGKQEDAEEFLSCILDGMHEEMSAAVNLNSDNMDGHDTIESDEGYINGYVHAEGDEVEGEPEEDSWEQVGPKKKSVLTRRANFAKTPIADIFAGLVRSAVYKSTAKETATLEPFFTLQLDIQSEKVWTVKDALEGLVSKEPISGYTCSKTNSEVEVIKKLSLEELPPVLILHLKCFVYNKDGGSQKLMKKVDYSIELEITKDLLSPSARNKLTLHQRSYKLFAVVYHHGKKATGGHYTTNVFHAGINGWVNSDDSQVRTVAALSVLKYLPPRVPYLLYYRRLDSH